MSGKYREAYFPAPHGGSLSGKRSNELQGNLPLCMGPWRPSEMRNCSQGI